MKLLMDEDSQSNVLVRLLSVQGHDVETVTQVGIAGIDDASVLAYAHSTERVLLTRNGRDFLALHQQDSQHWGILIEYQDTDLSKNMTYQQIAAAIRKIEDSNGNLRGEAVSINAWR